MQIENELLDNFRDKLKTVVLAILLDAKNGNEAAAAAHWHIMTADEILERWHNVNFTADEFFEACSELDKAVDALAEYDEDLAPALIVIRYYLERAPMKEAEK